MSKIDSQKIKNSLTRNVEQIIDSKHLENQLMAGKKLRIKHGVDPTGPKYHLGRAITLWKLKEFQDLGHKIILILGDYTAQIGDPSDKLNKRPFLSEKQVNENLKNYQIQISKILDPKKIEWHRNSKWLAKLTPRQLDELADLFSVQQMITRRNFKQRWDNEEEISIRELHYPLYQGYDSVAIKADLEIGGTDQLFNLLAGRKIQEAYGQKPQDIMTLKMLEGLDGDKMSTTRGNVVNISDAPGEQYGKIMSMRDGLILKYFELCTILSQEEIEMVKRGLDGGVNPRESKSKLAYEIVKLYHGEKAARIAEDEFNKIFQKRELPENMPIFKAKKEKYKLIDILAEAKFAASKGEARRLIEQGAVEIDGAIIKDWNSEMKLKNKMVIKVGKRRFIKIDL
ncbi:MAG: tyrosine--tRNA ligase [Patescibacteria group bacterium]